MSSLTALIATSYGLGKKNVPESVPDRVGIRNICTKRTQIWSIFSWTRFGYAFRTYGLYMVRRGRTRDAIDIIVGGTGR